jgi:uncharacterized protein YyaL (SSP411 family)
MNRRRPNRLIGEKSPYLLQHAYNPVDWYPWGDEAFEKAERKDRPIFLSIGYSTCHWCHVMEKESFEDDDVARLMNEAFVSIKVDREERPDIDSVYMTVCQMMTGSGGWPLTIVMTPEKKPFFAATYLPKEARFGRAGMKELIPRIKELWEHNQGQALASADKVTSVLETTSIEPNGEELRERTLEIAFRGLSRNFDVQHGGFSSAPKFPTPHNLMYLLRYWRRTGDERALKMVEMTLDNMRSGGIYDHLGFGFHRYSTDDRWLVPHFEKMLYDQALLAMAYTEAYQATGNRQYGETAREIFTYVLRDMTAPEGGFYSAEDADSEGEEGKFYLWRAEEIRGILTAEEAEIFTKAFTIQGTGNFREEATGAETGKNIPHITRPLSVLAKEFGVSLGELQERLEVAREKLFAFREKRVHPHKDDKILTDWNGLMIAALSKGAQAFHEPAYEEAATRAAEFLLAKLRDTDGRLYHRYRDGEAGIPAFLDDYAFLCWGLVELYEATFESGYLRRAIELNDVMLEHFWDPVHGGLYFSGDDAEDMLVRKKELYDGALPSGNSVAMLNLGRLSHLVGNSRYEEKAAHLLRACSKTIAAAPFAYTQFMAALDFLLGPSSQVVIVGNPQSGDTKNMIKTLQGSYIPNKVLMFRSAEEQNPDITRLAEYTRDLESIEGKATAFVCRDFRCDLPTTDAHQMLALLIKDVVKTPASLEIQQARKGL